MVRPFLIPRKRSATSGNAWKRPATTGNDRQRGVLEGTRMMQKLFDYEKRERNAEAAVNYLRDCGIPIGEVGWIYLFMVHESAELILKEPQVIKVAITFESASTWIRKNFKPCNGLAFHRGTAHKKFQNWKARGVMDKAPKGSGLFCNFANAQRFADELYESLENSFADFAAREVRDTPAEEVSNGGRCRSLPGVADSIDRVSEFKKTSQSINPILLNALRSLPAEIWNSDITSDRRAFSLLGEWWSETKPFEIEPELTTTKFLGAILAARFGKPKTDPARYCASFLPNEVQDNWLSQARSLHKRMNANSATGR